MEQIGATVRSIEDLVYKAQIGSPLGSQTKSELSSEEKQALHDALWAGFEPYCLALEKAQNRIKAFIRGEPPTALVLAGTCGCGKTHLAHVAEGHIMLIKWGTLISECDIVARIQASYNDRDSETEDDIINELRATKRLIIDDVGTAHVKQESQSWIEGIYWRLLDRRAEKNRQTMITTNLDLEQLCQRIGVRATSRLMGMMGNLQEGYVDLFGVKDYRLRNWK
jgi:DNA replication protein DnaC